MDLKIGSPPLIWKNKKNKKIGCWLREELIAVLLNFSYPSLTPFFLCFYYLRFDPSKNRVIKFHRWNRVRSTLFNFIFSKILILYCNNSHPIIYIMFLLRSKTYSKNVTLILYLKPKSSKYNLIHLIIRWIFKSSHILNLWVWHVKWSLCPWSGS